MLKVLAHMLNGANERFLQVCLKVRPDLVLANDEWSSTYLFVC